MEAKHCRDAFSQSKTKIQKLKEVQIRNNLMKWVELVNEGKKVFVGFVGRREANETE